VVELEGLPGDQVVLAGVRGLEDGFHRLALEVGSPPVTLDVLLGLYGAPETEPTDSGVVDSGSVDSGGPVDSGTPAARCEGCASPAQNSGTAWTWLVGLLLASGARRSRTLG
jgi:hypothetical protein